MVLASVLQSYIPIDAIFLTTFQESKKEAETMKNDRGRRTIVIIREEALRVQKLPRLSKIKQNLIFV